MIDMWEWAKQQPWWLLLAIPIVFGAAPRVFARALARAYPKGHPRRAELRAEVEKVPRWEQPIWIFDQLDLVLFEAMPSRYRRYRSRRAPLPLRARLVIYGLTSAGAIFAAAAFGVGGGLMATIFAGIAGAIFGVTVFVRLLMAAIWALSPYRGLRRR